MNNVPRVDLSRQRGVVLFTVLIFLVVLTLLGLSSISGTILGERVVQNSITRSLAYQAAEAALRDAEQDIDKGNRVGVGSLRNAAATLWTANCGAGNDQLKGLCLPSNLIASPVWSVATNWDNAVTFGQYTGFAWTSTPNPPKYLIEIFSSASVTGELRAVTYQYRITARGYDGSGAPSVTLQTVYY